MTGYKLLIEYLWPASSCKWHQALESVGSPRDLQKKTKYSTFCTESEEKSLFSSALAKVGCKPPEQVNRARKLARVPYSACAYAVPRTALEKTTFIGNFSLDDSLPSIIAHLFQKNHNFTFFGQYLFGTNSQFFHLVNIIYVLDFQTSLELKGIFQSSEKLGQVRQST